MIPLSITPIPAFSDNYIWLLEKDRSGVVVDPGDAAPVRRALADRQLELAGILVTHHHPDHIGGISALLDEFDVPVYGPRAESATIRALTHEFDDGDSLTLEPFGLELRIIAVPGHTLGHIAYVSQDYLFCGDTLFSAGCGRLFEGTPEQMYRSLSRIAHLPDGTSVFCTHEYTLDNLAFAAQVEPGNPQVRAYAEKVRDQRTRGEPSLPSSIGLERRINPFLRCEEPAIISVAEARAGRKLDSPAQVFAVLRHWKDGFRAPSGV